MSINTNLDVAKGLEVLKDIDRVATVSIIFSIIIVFLCICVIFHISNIHKKTVDSLKEAYSSSLIELRNVIEILKKGK